MSKLIAEEEMPAPRLELRWVRTGPTWTNRDCLYNLVIPLGEHDIRREDRNGIKVRSCQTVELGKTTATGGRCPLYDGDEAIDTPFRDGAHAKWDSAALGGLPIYAVCSGMAMLLEAK
jgi:hypothetical protein